MTETLKYISTPCADTWESMCREWDVAPQDGIEPSEVKSAHGE
jgi:hypothetical protein